VEGGREIGELSFEVREMNCQPQATEVARHFDRVCQSWNDVYQGNDPEGYLLRTRLKLAMSLVRRHAPKGGRALDLGCGCGPASRALARQGYEVLGIDLAPAMIEQARVEAIRAGVADRCRFQCTDVASIAPANGGFEVIVALGFIEYFDEASGLLRKMREWLADQGILVLQMTNRIRLSGLLEGKGGQRMQRNGVGLLTRQYSPGEMADLAAECGLRRIDYRGHSLGPIKIAGRFLPGYRAAVWLDRRMDALADRWPGRRLGYLGTSFISVFRRASS